MAVSYNYNLSSFLVQGCLGVVRCSTNSFLRGVIIVVFTWVMFLFMVLEFIQSHISVNYRRYWLRLWLLYCGCFDGFSFGFVGQNLFPVV